MRRVEAVVENYWVGYYLVFAVCLVILLWRHRWRWQQWDDVTLLGDVFSTAAGAAFLAVIIVEVSGRMVLLIPKTVKAIIEKGRAEGREEGRAEGREEGREEGRAEGREEGQAEGQAEGSRSERDRILSNYRQAVARGDIAGSPEIEDALFNGAKSQGGNHC